MTNQETSIMNTYINDIIPVPEERGYYNSIDDNVYLETRYMIQMLGWTRHEEVPIPTSGDKDELAPTSGRKNDFAPTSWRKTYIKDSIRWSYVIPMINECIHICREEGILFKDFNIYIDYTKENLPNYLPSQIVFYLGCNGRSQAAKEFRIRLFLHIIPEIQRKGQYITKQKLEELQKFKQDVQPAIHLYDEIANDEYFITISVIASNYGISAQELNTILHGLRFHYPCGGGWVLYDPYRSMGLAKTRTRQIEDGKTYEFVIGYNEKGRVTIDMLLHQNNLLTVKERQLEQNRLMQLQNQQTGPVQQPINYITNYYEAPRTPYQPGYRPNEATVIGPDGRLYDNQGRLVVITDKDGYPYGYKR